MEKIENEIKRVRRHWKESLDRIDSELRKDAKEKYSSIIENLLCGMFSFTGNTKLDLDMNVFKLNLDIPCQICVNMAEYDVNDKKVYIHYKYANDKIYDVYNGRMPLDAFGSCCVLSEKYTNISSIDCLVYLTHIIQENISKNHLASMVEAWN